MASQQGQPPVQEPSGSWAFSIVISLLNAYTGCFTLWLRSRMGSRYLTSCVVGGLGFQWLFFLGYPAPILIVFCPLWLSVAFWHRLRITLDARRGHYEHRQFHGYSSLVERLPLIGRCSDAVAKCLVEPGLVFLASYGMQRISPGLGAFFAGGGVAMCLQATLERALFQEKVARMRDAGIYNRHLAEYYRRWH